METNKTKKEEERTKRDAAACKLAIEHHQGQAKKALNAAGKEVDGMLAIAATQKTFSTTLKMSMEKVKELLGQIEAEKAASTAAYEELLKIVEEDHAGPEDSPVRPTGKKRKRAQKSPEKPTVSGETKRTDTDKRDKDWTTVQSKKKKGLAGKGQTTDKGKTKDRATRPSPRGTTVLINPSAGQSFADIVKTLRTMTTDQSGLEVRMLTKTKDGSVLLKTKQTLTGNALGQRLQDAVGDKGQVRDLTPRVTLEILDLDCLTTKEDVDNALDKELDLKNDRKTHVFQPNSRGQKMAVCEVDGRDATLLLKKGRIKIGFMSCRIRERVTVPRCYRCLGYGHLRRDCKGTDRTDCCWKCGVKGHTAKKCVSAAPSCYLCKEKGSGELQHVPGTARCAVFKAALTKRKMGTDATK